MHAQAKQMKAMLDAVVVVGSGAGGKVLVTFNGSHEVLGVKIEEGLATSVIESGVKDAIVDANQKLQGELMKKMQELGGGLEALKGMLES